MITPTHSSLHSSKRKHRQPRNDRSKIECSTSIYRHKIQPGNTPGKLFYRYLKQASTSSLGIKLNTVLPFQTTISNREWNRYDNIHKYWNGKFQETISISTLVTRTIGHTDNCYYIHQNIALCLSRATVQCICTRTRSLRITPSYACTRSLHFTLRVTS